jgi:chondroitin AC lyase
MTRPSIRQIAILTFTLVTAIPTTAEPQMSNETALIAERLRTRLTTSVSSNIVDQARELLDLQNENGSWADVDYDDESRTHWKPSHHLSHLERLSRAYASPSSELAGDTALRDGIRSGLQYWVDRHPVSDNWWFNVIGGPRQLSDILLLTVDTLSPPLIAGVGKLIHESGFTRTGANLVDEASNLLVLACATGDSTLLHECVRYISGEVRITEEEGIQTDDSFYQHGPQNMVISYGRGFAGDQAHYAELFAGTPFAFSDEKIRILSRFILDGQQWYIRGRQIDYHAMGRGAFRGGPGSHSWNASGFAGLSRRMAKADPSREAEYLAFAERVTGEEPAGSSGPTGNKHFWRSDTMVHREPGWYASVRFHSTRTYATETRTNLENLKGYHLSDGVYFILQRGDEYHEIQPVWNYRKLPGLTFIDTDAPIPYGSETPRGGNTSFVGGASDGLGGISVMDYDKAGVKAKKAYFFSPGGLVCLGAGIQSGEDESVLTTLNQCRLNGPITVFQGGKASALADSSLTGNDIKAIHHDGMAYLILEGSSVTIEAGQRPGSWQEVEAKASPNPVPQDVFTATIDHGPKPTDATYAYRIIPETAADELAGIASDKSVQLLANTPNTQAVHFAENAVTHVVFHTAGTIALPDGSTFTSDTPCAIIFRPADNNLLLTVADPGQTHPQLILTLDGRFAGRGTSIIGTKTQIVVDLPKALSAGQSVTLLLQRK